MLMWLHTASYLLRTEDARPVMALLHYHNSAPLLAKMKWIASQFGEGNFNFQHVTLIKVPLHTCGWAGDNGCSYRQSWQLPVSSIRCVVFFCIIISHQVHSKTSLYLGCNSFWFTSFITRKLHESSIPSSMAWTVHTETILLYQQLTVVCPLCLAFGNELTMHLRTWYMYMN